MEETIAENVPTVIVSFHTTTFEEEVQLGATFTVPKGITKGGLSTVCI